jgi:hypothetical protein
VVLTIVILILGLEREREQQGATLYLHVPTWRIILFATIPSKQICG